MSARIATAWFAYRGKCVPEDASAIQVQETRRAFYAGATTFLAIVMANPEPGIEATVDDLRMMDEIDAELKQFAVDVAKGRS